MRNSEIENIIKDTKFHFKKYHDFSGNNDCYRTLSNILECQYNKNLYYCLIADDKKDKWKAVRTYSDGSSDKDTRCTLCEGVSLEKAIAVCEEDIKEKIIEHITKGICDDGILSPYSLGHYSPTSSELKTLLMSCANSENARNRVDAYMAVHEYRLNHPDEDGAAYPEGYYVEFCFDNNNVIGLNVEGGSSICLSKKELLELSDKEQELIKRFAVPDAKDPSSYLINFNKAIEDDSIHLSNRHKAIVYDTFISGCKENDKIAEKLDECYGISVDGIYSLQNEELYEKIVQDAAKDFDNLEYEFRNSAESALGKFAAQSDDNLRLLLSQFDNSVDDSIKDIEERREDYPYDTSLQSAVEDFLDDNCSADELLSICRDFGLKVDEYFIVYAQNGEYEECYDKAQVLEGYNKLQQEYDGLAVVVYGVMGTEYKGVLKETPDAELTEKFIDKKPQKEKTDIEKE